MVEPALPVPLGEMVAGKYRLTRVLGSGAMGVVVAAEDTQLERVVAIKFVVPGVLEGDISTERFTREARAVAKLRSEHVVRVLDVGFLPNGSPFMVMEFLDGVDLNALVTDREKPLSIESVALYLVHACEALAEAHALGIVHRDLKPQNLFLTRTANGSPIVKVLDFGVSKIIGSQSGSPTHASALMGSPLYMAPEQMRSARDATPQSDVWSLGAVAFTLLTGRVPFEAESMPELVLKVLGDVAPSVASLREDVPPELDAIVARCLAKEPSNRFADARALAEALEPFLPALGNSASRASRSAGSLRALKPTSGTLRIEERPSSLAPRLEASTSPTTVPTTPPVPPKGSNAGVLIAAIIGALVIVVGGTALFFLQKRGTTDSGRALVPTVVPASASAPPVLTSASAPPSASATVSATSTPEPTAPTAPASVTAPPPKVVIPGPGPGPNPKPKPKSTGDDDIPNIR